MKRQEQPASINIAYEYIPSTICGGQQPVQKYSTQQVTESVIDAFSNQIINSTTPIPTQETETATVFGQTGIILNREEINSWHGEIPLSKYELNEDPNPEIIQKKSNKCIQYNQQIAVRYLRPPTPPLPGMASIKIKIEDSLRVYIYR